MRWVIWAPCTAGGEPGSAEHKASSLLKEAQSLARVHVYKHLRSFITELGVRTLPGTAHFPLLSLHYHSVCICL